MGYNGTTCQTFPVIRTFEEEVAEGGEAGDRRSLPAAACTELPVLSVSSDDAREEDGCACLEDIACRVRGGSSSFMSRTRGGPFRSGVCVCVRHAPQRKCLPPASRSTSPVCRRERALFSSRQHSRPWEPEAMPTLGWCCSPCAVRKTGAQGRVKEQR